MSYPATVLALLAFAAAFQTPDVGLRGVIRDQTGAVLQGAPVDLVDSSGKTIATTASDQSGIFRFPTVAPGVYALRVLVEGFRGTSTTVRVRAAIAPAALIIVLELAPVPQAVTVNGDSVVDAAAANRDAVGVTDGDIRDLPVFDRDVVATLSRFLDASALGTGGVTLVVDGMEARKVGVSPAAIQSIKVNQDPYSAEFPRPGRGRVEVVTKAGADAFHGSFDVTFRDSALNARDPFAPTTPPEQRRIYEGVLGGPVGGGKRTSFLFTVEGRQQDLQAIVYAATPAGIVSSIVATPERGAELSGSLNHQQGKRHTLFVRVTSEASNSRNQGVGGTILPEAASSGHGDEEQVILGARSILTSRLLSEFRWLLGREITSTASLNPAPRIVVLDAFTGGGAQSDQSTSEYHFNLAESLTYLHGRHLIKGGFAIPDFSRRGYDDRTNMAGTFTFSSLDAYAAGTPLSFVQQRGDGNLVFLQKVFGAFVQDQIRIGSRLSVTPGVRYDWQNIFADSNNVAPRISAALALDKTTALRGGAGVFYDRAGDSAIHDVLRSRENRLRRVILVDPSYPDPFSAASADAAPRSIVMIAPGIRTPYTVQFGGGIERQLRKGSAIAINYLGSRGTELFRSRDVNAPLPQAYLVRPDPALGQVRQIESTGRQTAHSLQVLASGRLFPGLQGNLQYTLSSAHNDTSGINALPADNYDLASEFGRADFDQRHHLEGLLRLNAGDWIHLGIGVSLLSGRPYSLRTGTDPFNTGQTNARPPGVARNTLQGPGYASVDLKWTRDFPLTSKRGDEAPAWSVGVSAFNVLNHVNYTGYVGTLTSPFFGRPIAAQPPRRIQVSAELHF